MPSKLWWRRAGADKITGMGVSDTFSLLGTLPPDQQFAFAEAALREPYAELQAAAFQVLSDPDGLNRPDLVFQRYLELLPEVRAKVAEQKPVFLGVAREQIRSPRDKDRRAGYEMLAELNGMDAMTSLVPGVKDPSPLVREKVADVLETMALRFYYHLSSWRTHGDPEGRKFVEENRAVMIRALEELLRVFPQHGRKVFLDVAIEAGPEAYSLFTDVILVRPASQVYAACVQTLSIALTETAVELLFKLCQEKEHVVREGAVEALKRRRDPEFAELLAAWLGRLPPERFASLAARTKDVPWWGTVEAARDLSPAAAALLLDFLARSGLDPALRDTLILSFQDSTYPDLRSRALAVLQTVGHPQLAQAATRALEDPSDEVKVQAVRLVISLNPPNKVRLLTPLLNSSHGELRDLVASEVCHVSFARYMESFEKLEPVTRELAARALSKIDSRMVDRLALEICSLDADRRLQALRVVNYAGAREELREVLTELLADPDRRVRATTVKLLHHSRNLEGMRILVGALNDPDPRVRANAIEAFEDAGDPRLAPALEPFLQDADNRIRANAAKALLALGRPEARGVLEEMLADPDEGRRLSAAWAIGEARFGGAEEILRARIAVEPSEKVRARILEALTIRAAEPAGA